MGNSPFAIYPGRGRKYGRRKSDLDWRQDCVGQQLASTECSPEALSWPSTISRIRIRMRMGIGITYEMQVSFSG